MEAIHSSETSFVTKATWCQILESIILHSQCLKTPISYIITLCYNEPFFQKIIKVPFKVLELSNVIIFLQSLRTEIDNHEPRIHLVCNNGQKLIDEGHEDAPEFTRLIDDLLARWQQLKDAVENRRNKLLQSEKAQQVRLCCRGYCLQYCGS
jgi:hypothetical protein